MATNWPNSVQTFTNPSSGSALNSPSHADQHATVNDTVEALQTYAGLVLVSSGTFSGASTVDVTGFSSSSTGIVNNYRLFYTHKRVDTSGASTATFQIRSSTTAQAAGYYYGAGYANYLGATGSAAAGSNVSSGFWLTSDSYIADSAISLDLFYTPTGWFTWSGTGYFTGTAYSMHYGGAVATSLTIDRMRITYATGTHSGQWQLHRYNV